MPGSRLIKVAACLAATVMLTGPAFAEEAGIFDEYRAMFGDDNPAIFVIEEGEEFWFASQGPKQTTLEACDLGLGPGVVGGAYARLPRYFKDVDRVMDVEARLRFCMQELQGRAPEEVDDRPYSLRGDLGTEMEALVAWLAEKSRDLPIAPGQE
ncbi:MAG: sulfur oxidation c-type cytochrome SoxA, partial [Halieaceae bacterium]